MKARRSRNALLKTSVGYRLYLRYQGVAKPQNQPSNYNAVLQTQREWQDALEQVKTLGLPPHDDPYKNWDSLAALSLIINTTTRKAHILDAGSELYSTILPWLVSYG